MRTYLVTGGAGFIGSNYIHYMFKKYDNEKGLSVCCCKWDTDFDSQRKVRCLYG